MSVQKGRVAFERPKERRKRSYAALRAVLHPLQDRLRSRRPCHRSASAGRLGPGPRTATSTTCRPSRPPLELATAWIAEPYHCWPDSTNPHLIVSCETAVDDLHRPARSDVGHAPFRRVGLRASELRQDWILDEARYTADPVHLMRVRSGACHRDEVRRRCPPRQEGRPDPSMRNHASCTSLSRSCHDGTRVASHVCLTGGLRAGSAGPPRPRSPRRAGGVPTGR